MREFGAWLFSKEGAKNIAAIPTDFLNCMHCMLNLSPKLNLVVMYEEKEIDYCPGIKSALKKIVAVLKKARSEWRWCYFKDVPEQCYPLILKLMLCLFPLVPYFRRLPTNSYKIISPYSDVPSELAGEYVIDGTCHNVQLVIDVAKKWQSLGYTIILSGEENEWETRIVNAHIQCKGLVVEYAQKHDGLADIGDKIAVIAQTSFRPDLFERNLEIIKKLNPLAKVVAERTFCPAIEARVESALRLTNYCDLIVVVGDGSSSQSNYIAKRLHHRGVKVFRVDSPYQIDFRHLTPCQVVGVVATTSISKSTVLKVIQRLTRMRSSLCHFIATEPSFFQDPCYDCPDGPTCEKIFVCCNICGQIHESCPRNNCLARY